MNTNQITYKILKTLDTYKGREDFDYKLISASAFDISYSEWEQVMIMLQKKGFIEGIVYTQTLFDKFPHIIEPIRPMITYDGSDFVCENSTMKKIGEALKMIGDFI